MGKDELNERDLKLYSLAKKTKNAMGGFWYYFKSGTGRDTDLRDKLLEMQICIKQALELVGLKDNK